MMLKIIFDVFVSFIHETDWKKIIRKKDDHLPHISTLIERSSNKGGYISVLNGNIYISYDFDEKSVLSFKRI